MKVSPAKAAGYSVLAAGSLTVAVLVVVFVVSRRRQERSINGGYLRGFVMKAPSWRRDATNLGAAVISDKEHIKGMWFLFSADIPIPQSRAHVFRHK
jgi:hypothetical protein